MTHEGPLNFGVFVKYENEKVYPLTMYFILDSESMLWKFKLQKVCDQFGVWHWSMILTLNFIVEANVFIILLQYCQTK